LRNDYSRPLSIFQLCCRCSLYILDIYPLQIHDLQYFFSFCVVFHALLIFNQIQLFFSTAHCVFGVIVKNLLPNPKSWRVPPPRYSSKRVIVWAFNLRVFNLFWNNFHRLYKEKFNFILSCSCPIFHVVIQFFQHRLLQRMNYHFNN
jgi:hypothetical protein